MGEQSFERSQVQSDAEQIDPPDSHRLSSPSFRSQVSVGLVAAVTTLTLVLLAPSVAVATTLPSTIKENTTLTPAGNPYTGSSTIEAGVTVKVEPGVVFKVGGLTVNRNRP